MNYLSLCKNQYLDDGMLTFFAMDLQFQYTGLRCSNLKCKIEMRCQGMSSKTSALSNRCLLSSHKNYHHTPNQQRCKDQATNYPTNVRVCGN